MKRIKLFFVAVFICSLSFSQELNCFVTVSSNQIQGTNKEIFNTLSEAITDFMNNTTWTNHVFDVIERIECNIQINLTQEVSAGEYKGTISIQARRPVYGSTYNTVMFNYIDEDLSFEYTQYDPLEFSEVTHVNNLTAVLAYYAYIIIGLDYDSFSPMGGTPYFEKAEKIVNNAQSASDAGWKAFESRGRNNRYWLVNNALDEAYSPLREFIYNYHRKGLDALDKSVDQGRLVIKEAMLDLEKFHKSKPDPFMFFYQLVIDAKSEELIKLFSEAPQSDKAKMYSILTKIDPANANKYSELQ